MEPSHWTGTNKKLNWYNFGGWRGHLVYSSAIAFYTCLLAMLRLNPEYTSSILWWFASGYVLSLWLGKTNRTQIIMRSSRCMVTWCSMIKMFSFCQGLDMPRILKDTSLCWSKYGLTLEPQLLHIYSPIETCHKWITMLFPTIEIFNNIQCSRLWGDAEHPHISLLSGRGMDACVA